MRSAAAVLVLASVLRASAGAAPPGLCPAWKPPVQVGSLDPALLPEESGLAVSRTSDRMYHINDSGDGPFFYVTDLKGGRTKKVSIEGFQPFDTEDISLGPCGKKTCVYVGDIGDNFLLREELAVVLVPEEKEFGDSVRPLKVLRLAYPDGPRNAEGMAVHPSGDLFIVSKETPKKKGTAPARFFRLPREKVLAAGEGPLVLEPWGTLDIPDINQDTDKFGRIATALDISPDGSRFVVLTYANAVEVAHDLSSGPVPAQPEHVRIPLRHLMQQESVGYAPDGRSFYYGTEHAASKRKGSEPPELMRVDCAK